MDNEKKGRETVEDVDAVIDRLDLTRINIEPVKAATRSDIYFPEWEAQTGVIDFYNWEHLDDFIAACEKTKDGYTQVEPYLFFKDAGAIQWTALHAVTERENPLGYEFCVRQKGDDYAALEAVDFDAVAAEVKEYADAIYFRANQLGDHTGIILNLLEGLRDYANTQIEIGEAFEDIDSDNEVVVTYQGKFYEKIERSGLCFSNDGKEWTVGAIVKEFRKPLED